MRGSWLILKASLNDDSKMKKMDINGEDEGGCEGQKGWNRTGRERKATEQRGEEEKREEWNSTGRKRNLTEQRDGKAEGEGQNSASRKRNG